MKFTVHNNRHYKMLYQHTESSAILIVQMMKANQKIN
jgi:hypothetical protein